MQVSASKSWKVCLKFITEDFTTSADLRLVNLKPLKLPESTTRLLRIKRSITSYEMSACRTFHLDPKIEKRNAKIKVLQFLTKLAYRERNMRIRKTIHDRLGGWIKQPSFSATSGGKYRLESPGHAGDVPLIVDERISPGLDGYLSDLEGKCEEHCDVEEEGELEEDFDSGHIEDTAPLLRAENKETTKRTRASRKRAAFDSSNLARPTKKSRPTEFWITRISDDNGWRGGKGINLRRL